MPLTKVMISNALATDKDAFHWDESIPGFGLKVAAKSGLKTFIFQYRFRGKSRRVSIGKVSDALTLHQAREKAKDYAADLRQGIDPLGVKQAERDALTVEGLIGLYLNSGPWIRKAGSTQRTDLVRVNKHILPSIGKIYADQLTPRHIEGMRQSITASGVLPTKALKLIRAIFGWGVSEGHISKNPAVNIVTDPDGNRSAILTPDQIRSVFDAINELVEGGTIPESGGDAVRVVALTGSRRSEIALLRNRYVDLSGSRLVIPASEHKGRRTGKPRTILLNAMALGIVTKWHEPQHPDALVFPPRVKGHLPLTKIWTHIREKAGLPDDFVLHSLRHSLASLMALNGASAPEIAQVLGHANLNTSARYIHRAADQQQTLIEKATAQLTEVLS